MYSEIMKTICQTGIFLVCAQVLVHIRPDKSYEKYLKMLVSAMILLQVFQPISSLLRGGGESLQERAAWFEEQLNESVKEAGESRRQAEELREQMSLEEVQRRLEEDRETPKQEGGVSVEKVRIKVGEGVEADEGETEGDVEEMVPQG